MLMTIGFLSLFKFKLKKKKKISYRIIDCPHDGINETTNWLIDENISDQDKENKYGMYVSSRVFLRHTKY